MEFLPNLQKIMRFGKNFFKERKTTVATLLIINNLYLYKTKKFLPNLSKKVRFGKNFL